AVREPLGEPRRLLPPLVDLSAGAPQARVPPRHDALHRQALEALLRPRVPRLHPARLAFSCPNPSVARILRFNIVRTELYHRRLHLTGLCRPLRWPSPSSCCSGRVPCTPTRC